MTEPTSPADAATDERRPTPRPAPLQMLGAAGAEGCDEGTCAGPADDDG